MAAKTKKPAKGGRRAAKPTKDETVETSETSAGSIQLLLGNMMAEKDRAYYVTTYLGLVAKKNKANSDLTEFGKKAKEAGVDMPAMKLALKLEGLEPLDLADYLKQLAAYSKDRGLPVQIQLFEPKHGSLESQAAALGWQAGIAGRTPPLDLFPEGTPGHIEMMRRFNDAQAEIIMNGAKSE